MTKYLLFTLGSLSYLLYHYYMNDIGRLIEIPKYVYLDLFGILLLSASAGFYLIKKNKIGSTLSLFGIGLIFKDIVIHLFLADFYWINTDKKIQLLLFIIIPFIGLLTMLFFAINSNLNPQSEKFEFLPIKTNQKVKKMFAYAPVIATLLLTLILY